MIFHHILHMRTLDHREMPHLMHCKSQQEKKQHGDIDTILFTFSFEHTAANIRDSVQLSHMHITISEVVSCFPIHR